MRSYSAPVSHSCQLEHVGVVYDGVAGYRLLLELGERGGQQVDDAADDGVVQRRRPAGVLGHGLGGGGHGGDGARVVVVGRRRATAASRRPRPPALPRPARRLGRLHAPPHRCQPIPTVITLTGKS